MSKRKASHSEGVDSEEQITKKIKKNYYITNSILQIANQDKQKIPDDLFDQVLLVKLYYLFDKKINGAGYSGNTQDLENCSFAEIAIDLIRIDGGIKEGESIDAIRYEDLTNLDLLIKGEASIEKDELRKKLKYSIEKIFPDWFAAILKSTLKFFEMSEEGFKEDVEGFKREAKKILESFTDPIKLFYAEEGRQSFQKTCEETVRSIIERIGIEKEDLIQQAIVDKNYPLIKILLEIGANIHKAEGNELSPLERACYEGDKEALQLLLGHYEKKDQIFDINQTDKNGYTLLNYAVEGNNTATAKLLLYKGADIHQAKEGKLSPLECSCSRGDGAMLQLFLDHWKGQNQSFDINRTNEYGLTLLCHSVIKKNTLTAKLLLNNGADINKAEKDAASALGHADHFKDEAMLQLLLDHGRKQDQVQIEIVNQSYNPDNVQMEIEPQSYDKVQEELMGADL